jgi:hypothetical protein
MFDINPCRKCGAPAVEHIRGEFHAKTRDDLPENRENEHSRGGLVSFDESIADDYRISCSRVRENDFIPIRPGDWNYKKVDCDNYLPWSFSLLKEVAKQKQLWNLLNPVKLDEMT